MILKIIVIYDSKNARVEFYLGVGYDRFNRARSSADRMSPYSLTDKAQPCGG